jgi:plasmid stabilization system protein ParE
MVVKRLEIHPSALDEFESSVTWYLERNRVAAEKFAAAVDYAIELVSDFPLRWPQGDYGTRRIILRRFPFAIVYREKQDAIQILAIAHGHRRPKYWKDRL